MSEPGYNSFQELKDDVNGPPLDKSNGEKSGDEPQTLRVEVTVALEKIYGGEIVDVETVAALAEAKP